MEDRGQSITITVVVFLVLCWTAVALRIWVRLRDSRRFWLDDWLLLISLIFFTVYGSFLLSCVYWGLGRHSTDPGVRSVRNQLQTWFLSELSYTVTSTLLRAAAAEQIMRHATRSSHRWMVYICNGINLLFSTFLFFAIIFRCAPVDHFWNRLGPDKPKGHCHPGLAIGSTYLQSGISAGIDITFATLPLFLVAESGLDRARKIGLVALCALGELSGIVMVLRLPALVSMTSSRNVTRTSVDVAIYSHLEPAIALIALSLAALGPLLTTNSTPPHRRRGRRGVGPQHNPYRHDRRAHESEIGLRGLPKAMGNTSRIEGGVGVLKAGGGGGRLKRMTQSFENLTKFGGGKAGGSVEELELGQQEFGIMKTMDVETYETFEEDDVELGRAPQSPFGKRR